MSSTNEWYGGNQNAYISDFGDWESYEWGHGMNNNLLGHLALKLGTHQELWATEALHYILGSSLAARQAFLEYVNEHTRVRLPEDLSFRTQEVATDGSIPDLVGVDEHNQIALVVEAKFWAGLTDNQPITYLKQLSPGLSRVLLFIVPTARLQTLWREILDRCVLEKLPPDLVAGQGEVLVARVAERSLALVSWRALLAHVIYRLELKRELTAAADVQQLLGLCEQMDQTAFLPVRSEELAPQIGRRLVQYCDLVDELTERLKQEKIGSTQGLRATAKKNWYGRYIKVYGYWCLIKFDYSLWGTLHETPLWFRVWNDQDAHQRLHPLEMEIPRVMIHRGSEFLVPLQVPYGVERGAVFVSLLAQVKRVTRLLERTDF